MARPAGKDQRDAGLVPHPVKRPSLALVNRSFSPRRAAKMLAGLLAVVFLASSSLQRTTSTEQPSDVVDRFSAPLQFRADGTFQLSILEDLHFGESKYSPGPRGSRRGTHALAPDTWDPWGPQQDLNSVKVINRVLDKEAPDLVVLNGDLITGENVFLENGTHYVDAIAAPLVARGLAWAATYGNHDYGYNVTGATILERERRWPNARTRQMVYGPDAGVSNYYLPVHPPGCPACAPELILWFFDSRGGWRYQQQRANGTKVGQPNWVDSSVVNWFEQTQAELRLRYQKPIPSLAFVHIPSNASLALQEAGVDPHRQPGINDDRPLAQQGQGWCADGRNDGSCQYGGQDGPFMQAIATAPGLMALFSGHDHGDSWCYKWDSLLPGMTVQGRGLNVCFGQHTGYGGYGNWVRGSRQILVTRSKLAAHTVDTWIRLETGDTVGNVSLNATYGRDRYPATPDDQTYCPTCNYTKVTPLKRRKYVHGPIKLPVSW